MNIQLCITERLFWSVACSLCVAAPLGAMQETATGLFGSSEKQRIWKLGAALDVLAQHERHVLQALGANMETARQGVALCAEQEVARVIHRSMNSCRHYERAFSAEVAALSAPDSFKEAIRKPESLEQLCRAFEDDALTVATYAHLYQEGGFGAKEQDSSQKYLGLIAKCGESLVSYAPQLFERVVDVAEFSQHLKANIPSASLEDLLKKRAAIERNTLAYTEDESKKLIDSLELVSAVFQNSKYASDNYLSPAKKVDEARDSLNKKAQEKLAVLKEKNKAWFAREIDRFAQRTADSAYAFSKKARKLGAVERLVVPHIAAYKQKSVVTKDQRDALAETVLLVENMLGQIIEHQEIETQQKLLKPYLSESQKVALSQAITSPHVTRLKSFCAETKAFATQLLHACPLCASHAEQSCGRCGQVFYCGKDHQKQDW